MLHFNFVTTPQLQEGDLKCRSQEQSQNAGFYEYQKVHVDIQ